MNTPKVSKLTIMRYLILSIVFQKPLQTIEEITEQASQMTDLTSRYTVDETFVMAALFTLMDSNKVVMTELDERTYWSINYNY